MPKSDQGHVFPPVTQTIYLCKKLIGKKTTFTRSGLGLFYRKIIHIIENFHWGPMTSIGCPGTLDWQFDQDNISRIFLHKMKINGMSVILLLIIAKFGL